MCFTCQRDKLFSSSSNSLKFECRSVVDLALGDLAVLIVKEVFRNGQGEKPTS